MVSLEAVDLRDVQREDITLAVGILRSSQKWYVA